MPSFDDDSAPRPLWSGLGAPIAHTPAAPGGAVHDWASHAREVGRLARGFGSKFGVGPLAELTGIVHDCGKLADAPQSRLQVLVDSTRREKLGVDHKFEGAAISQLFFDVGDRVSGEVLATVVQGHHGGMPSRSELVDRVLAKPAMSRDAVMTYVRRVEELLDIDLVALVESARIPSHLYRDSAGKVDGERLELLTRLVHSALVDADFLDTAAHFAGTLPATCDEGPAPSELDRIFHDAYRQKYADAPATELNALRGKVFDACVAAGEGAGTDYQNRGGIFRLPAQTGMGKTMAAAAFALAHARAHGKDRVIVAVPFTTITTQNAAAYRSILEAAGPNVVLEHHSNVVDELEPAGGRAEDPTPKSEGPWARLAAENWDARFVVTTTVQLFESLFQHRPSRTRRLHRVANAVVVLDEVQSLPLELLPQILGVMRQLAQDYGATFLLASATQPAFWSVPVWRDAATDLADPAHPIDILPARPVPEVTRRVRWDVLAGTPSWPEVAERIAAHRQTLTIVNSTKDARTLAYLLVGTGSPLLHLSSRMTAHHRTRTLSKVRRRLKAGEPVALCSTQLVEAGVDISFPVVFRALAPAEAMIQAAGRCNREGELGPLGGVCVVFNPEDGQLPGELYRDATETARRVFMDGGRSLDDPDALADYFESLYARRLAPHLRGKAHAVGEARRGRNFPEAARLFRMIEQVSLPVVVVGHAGDDTAHVADILSRLGRAGTVLTRADRQLLSRHTAQAPRWAARQAGLVEEVGHETGVFRWVGGYDATFGLECAPTAEASIW